MPSKIRGSSTIPKCGPPFVAIKKKRKKEKKYPLEKSILIFSILVADVPGGQTFTECVLYENCVLLRSTIYSSQQ